MKLVLWFQTAQLHSISDCFVWLCVGYGAVRVGFHSLWHLRHQACGCEHTHTLYMHAELISRWVESPDRLRALLSSCTAAITRKNHNEYLSHLLSHAIPADLSVNTAAVETDPAPRFSPSFVTCVIICLFSKYLQLCLSITSSLSADISNSRCEDAGVSIFFPA